MINRFKELEKREQHSLIVCMVVMCLFVLYQFLLKPFNENITKLKKDIHYQSELQQYMKTAQTKLGTETVLKHISPDNLLSETTQALKKAKLDQFTYDLQQADNDSVRLNFKQVPYLSFMKWMEQYWSLNALSLQSASIKPSPTPGTVQIAIRFSVK